MSPPVTEGSVNPARALGPMLVSGSKLGGILLYVLAPLIYDRFVSDAAAPWYRSSEYPRSRIYCVC